MPERKWTAAGDGITLGFALIAVPPWVSQRLGRRSRDGGSQWPPWRSSAAWQAIGWVSSLNVVGHGNRKVVSVW